MTKPTKVEDHGKCKPQQAARSAEIAQRQTKTRKQRLQELLRRKNGVSLNALQKEFGWQPHTVRAAISGVRKAGSVVICQAGKSGSVYRIVEEQAGQ